MDRIHLIQALIDRRAYQSYLEIGCYLNECFSVVRCRRKVGVDPVCGGTLKTTSDAFFSSNQERFDLIFIDGDHHHSQASRDLHHAIEALSEGGAIVMHDCNPHNEQYEGITYCGTAWRAFAAARESPNLRAAVFDFDHGVGVIFREPNPNPIQIHKSLDELVYQDLVEHRSDWMNLSPATDLEAFISRTTSSMEQRR